MTSLVDSLTASGGTASAGLLNDIVTQLWPNVAVAGAQMTKEIVEPILASTLPGPLSGLRFVKLDFGNVPIRLLNVDVQKTTSQGIKIDLDVDWAGNCDIELDGKHVPKIGIQKVQLKGRLSILLCPLTNIIPLIGAAQVAFINPPTLNMDFTNAANIADCFLVGKTVRNVILGIIESMAVLPNRFLVKLDANNDYFKTYQPHQGILRLTVEKLAGINGPKKSGASKLLAKIVKDVPDCYVKVKIGAEEEWRTSVQKNKYDPEWNETHDFLVSDYEQAIAVDVLDSDVGGDDDLGQSYITVKDLLLKGGSQELTLTHKDEATDGKLTILAKFYNLVANSSLLTATGGETHGKNQICGLVTILIGSALGLSGQRDELNPCVKVTLGDKSFLTAAQTYTPGTDIFNPAFDQSFRIPLTSDMMANPAGTGTFKISLMNKKAETGSVEIPFKDVVAAPDMVKEGKFDVGSGATIRARITVHGIELAK